MFLKYRDNSIRFFFVAATIVSMLFLINITLVPTYGGDTEWYVAAAEGKWTEIIQPYSARFLHPFIVGLLSLNFSLDIYQSFLVVGLATVFLFFVINALILKKSIRSPLLLFPLFLSPYFLATLREVFEPDAFYLFLTALFFAFLYYEKEWASLITLYLLFLTRESTIFLAFIFIIVSWLRSKKALSLAAFLVFLISYYTSSSIGSLGEPNIHGLSGSIYIISKLFYNFFTNVLGTKLWANTYDGCEALFSFGLPFQHLFGLVARVGFCGFDFLAPVKTLVVVLTTFGLAPLILCRVLIKEARAFFRDSIFWLLLAVVYGVLHYLIGIVAGTGVSRIVGYGYSAFLLATPFLMEKFLVLDKKSIIKLLALNLFVMWLPFVVQKIVGDTILAGLFVIVVVIVSYWYALKNIKLYSSGLAGSPVS